MFTNALIHEKSPYLRQHAHNPVDWLPWGEEAFAKAKREDKPIFLSIGYSTCHWCHVMAHESFENAETAAVLNQNFVSIKLDREERPDVDRIYMLFVQASTGSGGWPMSVWLTPDRKPFFGGTYFPPDSRYNRPGFRDLLGHLNHAWKTDRAKIEQSGQAVLNQLQSITASAKTAGSLDRSVLETAYLHFRRSFDSTWGGFGTAPKFPRPSVLQFLLAFGHTENNEDATEMTVATLAHMAQGGMHDQLGGGFHRYSVDERWFVPHFEKMLYDQAQLASAYLDASVVTHDESLAGIAQDIFSYVLRDMTAGTGVFYSAEDADSPDPENTSHSGEGAFYIWRRAEIDSLLNREDASLLACVFGVENDGNVENDPHGEFTGRNILYRAKPVDECVLGAGRSSADAHLSLARSRETLFGARALRPRPHRDEKVLTSWNCLMISAFAKGAKVLGDRSYLQVATAALNWILQSMHIPGSDEMLRRYCDGEAAIPCMLDDYALLAQASLDVFEAGGEPTYLRSAVRFADQVLKFEDPDGGGFFATPSTAPDLVLRMKEDYDGAEPSGNSVATDVLLRLAHLTGHDDYRLAAERSLRALFPKLQSQPTMAPTMLVALGRWLTPASQIVIRCAEWNNATDDVLREYRRSYAPYTTLLVLTDAAVEQIAETAPFLASLVRQGRTTIYRCREFTCELPEIRE
jgi:uncharacterized protein